MVLRRWVRVRRRRIVPQWRPGVEPLLVLVNAGVGDQHVRHPPASAGGAGAHLAPAVSGGLTQPADQLGLNLRNVLPY